MHLKVSGGKYIAIKIGYDYYDLLLKHGFFLHYSLVLCVDLRVCLGTLPT